VAKSLSANVQFCYLRIWQKDILNQDNQNTICSDPANREYSLKVMNKCSSKVIWNVF